MHGFQAGKDLGTVANSCGHNMEAEGTEEDAARNPPQGLWAL